MQTFFLFWENTKGDIFLLGCQLATTGTQQRYSPRAHTGLFPAQRYRMPSELTPRVEQDYCMRDNFYNFFYVSTFVFLKKKGHMTLKQH